MRLQAICRLFSATKVHYRNKDPRFIMENIDKDSLAQSKKLYDLRNEHETLPITIKDLPHSPFDQFNTWFKRALEIERGIEANAISLATVDQDGWPNNRMVILRDINHGGFVFYSGYSSAKGKELSTSHGKTAACFYWPTLNYQIRIRGVCHKITAEESDEYFSKRAPKGRAFIAISPQSEIIPGDEELDKKLTQQTEDIENGKELKRPDFWGGYRLIPDKFEFWQGSRSRLHQRFVYERSNDSLDGKENWKLYQLAP